MARTAAGQQRLHRGHHKSAVAVLLFLSLMASGCYSRVLEGAPAAVDTGGSSSSSSGSSNTVEAEQSSDEATPAGGATLTADPSSISQPQLLNDSEVQAAAKRLTCSNSRLHTPNVPFNCEAFDLSSNPAASDAPITPGNPLHNAEICCSAKIISRNHPDVYCKLVSSRNRAQPGTAAAALADTESSDVDATSALADTESSDVDATSAQELAQRSATVVGTAVTLQLEIGSLGLGVEANDVVLRGNVQGFRVVEVRQLSGKEVCAFNASCPARSSLSCIWSSLKSNSKKTLLVSMVAVDAGNHTSAFSVRAAGPYDMNPDNNAVKLPYVLTAGCCMADASGQPTCKDMSREACVANNGLAFSPGLPCAKRPCDHRVVKANAAAKGQLGTCSFAYRCFELIRTGACQVREGVTFSHDICSAAQASGRRACQSQP